MVVMSLCWVLCMFGLYMIRLLWNVVDLFVV